MAKSKSFGVNDYIKSRRKKRPGRHSKKHKKARFSKGQGKPI